jgi:hypothetical protein
MVLLVPIFTTAAAADSGVIIEPKEAKKFAVMPGGLLSPKGLR